MKVLVTGNLGYVGNVLTEILSKLNFQVIGCDSNWITATDTMKTGDDNHFHPDYHAFIGDGAHEFWRMNTTHETARKYFDEKGVKIMNAGVNSAITAYEKINFKSLFN